MPKDFGDWFGEQGGFEFNDPGNWKPAPKKEQPKSRPVDLIDHGFQFALNKREWQRICSVCRHRGIFIRDSVAQDYLDYCLKNKLDPSICSYCQPN